MGPRGHSVGLGATTAKPPVPLVTVAEPALACAMSTAVGAEPAGLDGVLQLAELPCETLDEMTGGAASELPCETLHNIVGEAKEGLQRPHEQISYMRSFSCLSAHTSGLDGIRVVVYLPDAYAPARAV